MNVFKAITEARAVEFVTEAAMICSILVVTAYSTFVLAAGTNLSSLPIA